MTGVFFGVVSGVGLFLLGMGLLTEGLRAMAGDAIKSKLAHYTRSPVSGVVSGAVGTALLQSSSATIITTVGFVAAGLLTYSQALSLVLGASIGSTFTGWLVALVGFKLQFGALASGLVLVGALLRLFGGSRRSGLAFSVAGFGLMFVGINTLQLAMSSLQGTLDFSQYAGPGLAFKLQLALMGVLFTLITQSSGAGVVAALTAMHSGVIDFEQAAALVVGMNVGTTFTSAVATIGGDANVRRTGFSHVLYNFLVSSGAIFLVSPYARAWQALDAGQAHPELALVAFHTLFNLLGVVMVLPFIRQYASFMQRLFPEPKKASQGELNQGLLPYPELALTAVYKVLAEQAQRLAQQVLYMLGALPRPTSLPQVAERLEQVRDYVDAIHLESGAGREWQRLMAAIALIDHLQRLHDRCQNKAVLLALHDTQDLHHARDLLLKVVEPLGNGRIVEEPDLQKHMAELAAHEEALRDALSQKIAQGKVELKRGVSLMEAARWLQRVSVHLGRIDHNSRQLSYQSEAQKRPAHGFEDAAPAPPSAVVPHSQMGQIQALPMNR